jgi:NADPH:quinone reductase-like Zn-dependent oxidoreductase
MAPTEVLAEQHELTMRSMLDGLTVPSEGTLLAERPVRAALLTNRTPAAERRRIAAALTDGQIDILDIGGNRSLSSLRRVLAKDGTLVIVRGEAGGNLIGGVDRQLRAMMLSAFVSQKLTSFISGEKGEDMVELKELAEAGKLKPVIDRTFPLADAPEAIRHIESGKARGKVVVTV